MNKWASRTYWLIVALLVEVFALLIARYITPEIWLSATIMLASGWIGNDLTNKIKGKNEQ